MSSDHPIVKLGFISGVHGLKGWVKVHSWTDPREAILEYSPWLLGREQRPVEIVTGRKQGKTLVAQLPGVDTPEQARQFIKQEISILRDEMPEPDTGAYYWSDLVGLQVETIEGESLGTVHSLLETGAHDVLVIRGDRERLVPFVHGEYIKSVDLEDRIIQVDWDPEF